LVARSWSPAACHSRNHERGLGGYPITDGGTALGQGVPRRPLHKLTEADLVTFRSLGVRTVYDLRGQVERTDSPVVDLHVPIVGRPADVGAPPAGMTTPTGRGCC
jgi:hypothetical protein